MSDKIFLRVHVTVKETDSSYGCALLDRDITVRVPPGKDPMDALHDLVSREFHAAKRQFDQFPEHLALAAPEPMIAAPDDEVTF